MLFQVVTGYCLVRQHDHHTRVYVWPIREVVLSLGTEL